VRVAARRRWRAAGMLEGCDKGEIGLRVVEIEGITVI